MHTKKNILALAVVALLLALTILPVYALSAEGSRDLALLLEEKTYLPVALNPVSETNPQSDSFTFVSWADTKAGTSTLASLSKQVDAIDPAFTLFPGDLEGNGFTTSGMNTWKTAVNGKSSNGMFDITFPVRGNHDKNSTSGWQSYFNLAETSARIGATNFTASSKNLTYAFDYQNATFIGIDTPGDADLITSTQIAFLDSRLTAAEEKGLSHAFLFFHGPIYPVSGHADCPQRTCPTDADIASLIKVLNKHAIVSAVFNGHEHLQAYVHMDTSRVPEITHSFEQFITGAAGAPLYSCDKTYRFDYCGSYQGFAAITVSGKTFTVKYYEHENAAPVKTYRFTKE